MPGFIRENLITMTFKAIDLFAGAGGISLGAHQAGVDIVAAIEFDEFAANTYKNNLINTQSNWFSTDLSVSDINSINPVNLKKKLHLSQGELDFIFGGPPCQGFSTHRIKNAGVDDPRNELLLKYFEFVHAFKPKVFMVENVAGLLWQRHEDYLKTFLSLAESEGYQIKFCSILNAKDFGVPQNRKRVFILGVNKAFDHDEFTFPPPATHSAPSDPSLPDWIPASSVFEPIPDHIKKRFWSEYFKNKASLSFQQTNQLLGSLPTGKAITKDDPGNFHMQPNPAMVERFADTPLNGSREDAGEKHRLRCHANGYKGHKDVYGRVLIHTPSNTITTGCNNPSKGRFVHPWLNHGITLRHAARLQTFPDWFKFYGNSSQQAKQIGNAVPPLLAKKLIDHICERLKLSI